MLVRRTILLACVAAIVALAALLYVSIGGAAQNPAAINRIGLGIGTHGNLSSEMAALESGVRFFRNDITLAPSQIGQIRNESGKYGAQYLGILDYETVAGKNWTLGDWNASVANAVREYPEISAWEVWNQPWYAPFQTGMVNGSAYNYYIVTRAAYLTIKAAEPNATVVCFGGAPIDDYGTYLWYAQAWGYGMGRYCDAISIHAYPSLPFDRTEQESWAAGLSAYENMTGKPIWITETGLPIVPGAVSQAEQASFLEDDVSFFSNLSYVKRVYWFDLWGMSGQYDFGLLNATDPRYGSPKPAWQVFLGLYKESASAG